MFEEPMALQKNSVAYTGQQFGARRLRTVILNMLVVSLLVVGHAAIALAYDNVPFEDLDSDQCYMFSQFVPTRAEGNRIVELPLELVINDEADYRKLFDPKILVQRCTDVDPPKAIPDVNFSNKTVLGLWSSGSCAAVGFEKKVLRDDVQKRIVYTVSVVRGSVPACMGPGLQSLNLIAIPKVPAEYKVFFDHIRE
jgi:hypothetical protein